MLWPIGSLRKHVGGATSIEYGIIAALISCGIVASVGTLGGNLGTIFSDIIGGLGGSATISAPPPNNTNHFNG